jgi:hypothetical protein
VKREAEEGICPSAAYRWVWTVTARLALFVALHNVRFWHKAGISLLSFNVRFWG